MPTNPPNNRHPGKWWNSLYRLTPKTVPGPGSGNWALYPAFSLPAQSMQGPGTIYGGGSSGLDILPPFPQVVYHQAQVVDGINGVVYSGVYSQGLVDMEKYVKAQAA